MAVNIGKGITNVADIKWQGMDVVLKNLNKEIGKIKGATVDGLLEAALLIKGDAQRVTPVDTGNLRASAYVIWGGGGKRTKARSNPTFKQKAKAGKRGTAERFKNIQRIISEHTAVINERSKLSRDPFAEIGFTAFYAAAVHENLKSSHAKLQRPGKRGTAERFRRVSANIQGGAQVGQAKFLEQAFVKNTRRILSIITRRARIR